MESNVDADSIKLNQVDSEIREQKLKFVVLPYLPACYVVLEWQVKPFDPEFAGKLNFYVNAVNEFIRRESDNPTIGLLICKDMDRTEVQLAFQGITTLMGIATYDNVKIQEIQEYLLNAEQIQWQIEIDEEEYKLSLQKKDGHEDV